jgi:pyruvate formate lyase activating enzyme
MNIAGLQKMTLLDFPGRVACTVFLGGCNFRCPFCHNSELFMGKPEKLMEDEEFFAFLKSRKGLLDGVCVSGGEPTLYPGLEEMLRRIKALGFAVKLDTNGSRPEVLKALVEKGLVDHVAMDVKNGPQQYGETTGTPGVSLEKIEESLRFLMTDAVSYELRTTVVEPLHEEASILEMGRWFKSLVPGKKPRVLYLQKFVDRDTVIFSGLSAPSEEEMVRFREVLIPFVESVRIRGE